MTLSAATVWEVRSLGDANGGGGFVAGTGVDYSQSNTPFATYTDLVIGASNSLTSVVRPFIADDVGNLIRITSGTGFTVARYEVVSVAGGAATLDRSPGTLASSGGNGKLGGAMTMTDANLEIMEPGNTIWVKKDGTYTPGSVSISAAGTATLAITVMGYNSTRGDCLSGGTIVAANRPLISNGASTTTFGNYWKLHYLTYTGTVAGGMRSGLNGEFVGCSGVNTSTGNGLSFSASTGRAIACEASSSGGAAISAASSTNGMQIKKCYIHDSVVGINFIGTVNDVEDCIIDTCTTGIDVVSTGHSISRNTFYGCTTGIAAATATACVITDNILHTCTTGINWSGGHFDSNVFTSNNFWNNGTDSANAADLGIFPTYIDPGFTDAPNGNFTPTSAIQATPFPTKFPGDLTNNYAVPGAAQLVAGGGGGAINPFNGIIVSG